MREELCSSLPKIEDLWDKMRDGTSRRLKIRFLSLFGIVEE